MQITERQIPPQERRGAGEGWSQQKVLEGLDVGQETNWVVRVHSGWQPL